MKKTYATSLQNIPQLAKEIAGNLTGGEVFALVGDLGAGKTTFTKALAKELKVKAPVTSPTFVLMNRYTGRLPSYSKKPGAPLYVYHLDLYRTKNVSETKALGIEEFWGTPGTLTLIEWADKIKRHLPKKTIFIYFK